MMGEFALALSRVHAAETAERGGTGGARRNPLHEAGSPSRPAKARPGRRKPPKSASRIAAKVVERAPRPPQER
jgi:hypothetical protein